VTRAALALAAIGFAALGATAVHAAETPALPTGEWRFEVMLDGTPIGEHRFSVTGQGDQRQVVSDARFDVRLLGFSAYRYRHRATEQWLGGCLVALESSTDDDGKPSRVQARREGDAFDIKADGRTEAVKGCVMSFAYWNPALQALNQGKLLNAQTGKLETVQVQRGSAGSVEVRGKPVAATEFRISGAAQPIELWFSPKGDWIGLDSTVAGGRKLTYRLP